ncbi:MAG: energy-coupling factor transporter transmembrane component T [Gudongella sp.]|nr:energy-coupling factor transporter transmembrane component T [Gudongella sp.]
MMKANSLDPRTKIFIVAIISTLGILYRDIKILSLIFVITLVLAFILNHDLLYVIKRLKRLLIVVFFIAFVQSVLTNQGEVLIQFYGVNILTDYGLLKAAEFILRIGIIILASVIITTSSRREILQGLVQLKIPYEIVFMVTTAIKFLPMLRDEAINMFTAIQLRGLDFKKIGFGKKLKVYKYLLLPIIISSILKAKELSIVMEMRGLRAYPTRTSYRQLSFSLKDYATMGISVIITIMFVVLN